MYIIYYVLNHFITDIPYLVITYSTSKWKNTYIVTGFGLKFALSAVILNTSGSLVVVKSNPLYPDCGIVSNGITYIPPPIPYLHSCYTVEPFA
jgi:hypothetical protein